LKLRQTPFPEPFVCPALSLSAPRQNQTISRLAKSKKDRVEKCYLTCLTTTFHNYEPAKKYQTVRYEPTWGTDARKIPLQSHLPDIGPRSSPTLRGRTPRTNRFPVDFTLSGAVGARKFPLHQETNKYLYTYLFNNLMQCLAMAVELWCWSILNKT
jgi:hypothetical protein